MPQIASSPLRGIAWMVAAALSFSVVIIMIRVLSATFPVSEIVNLRAVLGMVLMLPMMVQGGRSSWRIGSWRVQILRAVLVMGAQLCWYLGVREMPLADASALHFTLPLFGVVLAVMVLGERAGRHRWIATFVGFLGALVIIRPGFAEINPAAGAVLASAALYAGSNVMAKRLSGTESTNAIVYYNFVLIAALSAVPAGLDWVMPGWVDMPGIIVFGLAGVASQWCLTRSYRYADASLLAPVDFLRLPAVGVFGYVYYAEVPDPMMWVGAPVILGSVYYVARQEARRRRMAAAT